MGRDSFLYWPVRGASHVRKIAVALAGMTFIDPDSSEDAGLGMSH
jgi:hypothetical protein